ncbi:MAG: hypothetical protein AB8B94_13865 [Hyphomicrobiales bacterium]
MNRLFWAAVTGLVLLVGYVLPANAVVAISYFSSQANQEFLGMNSFSKNVHPVAGIGKAIGKLNPGRVPGFKGLPSRPKVSPPPRGLQPPRGLSNAPTVRAAPPSAAPRPPRAASALPPSTVGKLPPATGLRNAPGGGGFRQATVPTTPRRFDGNTVGIGNRSIRKANPTDNVVDSAAKPSSWKAKAITGGIGVFILLQFAPDIIVSQIDFSTDEETAAAGN